MISLIFSSWLLIITISIIGNLPKESQKELGNIISIIFVTILNFILFEFFYLKSFKKNVNKRRDKYFKFENFISSKNREEILGDLYEQKEILLADGLPEKQVNTIIFKKKVFIILFQYLSSIQEWFEKQTKITR